MHEIRVATGPAANVTNVGTYQVGDALHMTNEGQYRNLAATYNRQRMPCSLKAA